MPGLARDAVPRSGATPGGFDALPRDARRRCDPPDDLEQTRDPPEPPDERASSQRAAPRAARNTRRASRRITGLFRATARAKVPAPDVRATPAVPKRNQHHHP